MKVRLLLSVCLVAVVTQFAGADEYKVSGVHNCCGACAKGITEALQKVEGVTGINAEAKETTISFSASDAKTARKAIAALGRAGFHGKVEGGKNVKYRDNSGVEAGKVEELTLVGVHNCCPGCAKAVEAAVKKVDGVDAHRFTKNKKGVILTGSFDGVAVVKSLNEAGFHVRKKGTAAGKKKKAE